MYDVSSARVTHGQDSCGDGCAGLSAEKLEDGRWRIWVHIADPTRWLQSPHSQLVREAERRNQSLYLPTGASSPALPAPPRCGVLLTTACASHV